MADMCLCGLVVSGPTLEVKRFIRAAAPARRKTGKRSRNVAPGPLSFQRLYPVSDEVDPSDVYGTPSHEPEDCARSTPVRTRGASARVDYAFLTKWGEPYLLVREVSKKVPSLDFVLGAVAPAVGEANSWYFRNGRGRNWRMAARQYEGIYRRIYTAAGLDPDNPDINSNEEFLLDIEFDHALMDLVVAHWTAERKKAARRRKPRAPVR